MQLQFEPLWLHFTLMMADGYGGNDGGSFCLLLRTVQVSTLKPKTQSVASIRRCMKHIFNVSLLPAGCLLLRSSSPVVGFLSRSSPSLNRRLRTRSQTPCFILSTTPRRISISASTTISVATNPVKMPLSYSLLAEQNANTTNAIIQHFAESPAFVSLSSAEGAQILQRDEEDAQKLQKGIDIAKEKGVIDPNFKAEEYITVDVLGKSPEEVADEILDKVRKQEGEGGVVVLCGLSGTGKVGSFLFQVIFCPYNTTFECLQPVVSNELLIVFRVLLWQSSKKN
jgi:hypothetical protein